MRSHEPMLQQKYNTSSMITSVPTITNCLVPKNNNTVVAHRLSKSSGNRSPLDRPSIESRRTFDNDGVSGSSEHSSSTATCQTQPVSQFEPKVLLRFIDSSVDNESPPNVNAFFEKNSSGLMNKNDKPEKRKLSAVSMGKNVEFRDDVNGGLDDEVSGDVELSASLNLSQYSTALSKSSIGKKRNRKEADSAVDDSISSSENNPVGFNKI